MTSVELLSALARADASPVQWAELVGRHGCRLWAVCRAAAGIELADDAFQESLIAIRQGANRFRAGVDPEASAQAWMVTIAHRTAIDLLRRETRRRKRETKTISDTLAAPSLASADVESELHLALRLLERLPERHQLVIRLRLLGGLDASQTAAVLGCPNDQVRVRLHRALDLLRGLVTSRISSPMSVSSLIDGIAQSASPPATLPGSAQSLVPGTFSMAPVDALSLATVIALCLTTSCVIGIVAIAITRCISTAAAPPETLALAAGSVREDSPAIPRPPSEAVAAAAQPSLSMALCESWRSRLMAKLLRPVTLHVKGADAIHLLMAISDQCELPTVVDIPDGHRPLHPVSISVDQAPLQQVLDAIVETTHLRYAVYAEAVWWDDPPSQEGQEPVICGIDPQPPLATRMFSVALSGDNDVDLLVDRIKQHVDPSGWDLFPVVLRWHSRLFIDQTPSIHAHLERFIRNELNTSSSPARPFVQYAPATSSVEAPVEVPQGELRLREALRTRVDLAYDCPSIRSFLDRVSQRIGMDLIPAGPIDLDRPLPHRLAAAHLTGIDARNALCLALRGSGLRVVMSTSSTVVGAAAPQGRLLVTTTIRPQLTTRTYRVREIGAAFSAPATIPTSEHLQSLIDLITEEVDPTTWQHDGVAIDEHDGDLIICQSLEVHADIEERLDEWADSLADPKTRNSYSIPAPMTITASSAMPAPGF